MADREIAVIGLGLMGSRMSANLLEAGFELRGFDVDSDRRREFSEAGGTVAESPADAVVGLEQVLLSLPTSEVSREVCLGADGIIASGATGLLVYDTTTGRPQDSVDIASALDIEGIVYSDTTVSGNGAVAERGELVVMMGGAEGPFESGVPIFEAIGRAHYHVGPVGAGSRMKLVVNHMLSIHRLALAEGLVTAEKAGMDLDVTLEVLRDSLAHSKAMDLWGERMVEGDHEVPFARLRQSHKDSKLIVEHARSVGADASLISVVEAALAEGEDNGLSDYDNSSVMEVMRRRAGIGRVE